MLYVVETDHTGRVAALVACEDGIDQALNVITSGLVGPEEDDAAVYDVVADRWASAVRYAEMHGGTAYHVFVADRGRNCPRFGLASVA